VGSPGTIGASTTPLISVTAIDANASETGSDSGTFRISRTGTTVGALTVNYTLAAGAGQASAADYSQTLAGVVTIPSGQSSVDIAVTPIDDALFEGTETVTLTLFDAGSYDVGSPSAATITIADNDPPDTFLDSMPGDPTSSTSAHFTFSASNPAAAIARLECALDAAAFTTCTSPVDYTSLGDGSHTFMVRAVAVDSLVDPTPASFTWTVDTARPIVSCAATPNSLWPPNGKMIPISVAVNVSDAGSGPAGFTLVSVTSNEPGSDDIQGFTIGTASTTGLLQASRLGSGNGHTYTLTYSGADKAGNTTACVTTVVVPHDKGK
jgi:hypothetical protein